MKQATLLCAAALLLAGCSGERAEAPPAGSSSAAPSVFDSALVAGGGVTFELPEGMHRDLVQNNCTPCHSPALIMQQQLSREQWDERITWMQKKQNLWKLDPPVREAILDYLAEQFGAGADVGESDEPLYLPNPVW